jgi:hypothetical protein
LLSLAHVFFWFEVLLVAVLILLGFG